MDSEGNNVMVAFIVRQCKFKASYVGISVKNLAFPNI